MNIFSNQNIKTNDDMAQGTNTKDDQLNQSLQLLQDADMSIDDIFGCEQIRSPKWNNIVCRITEGPPISFPKRNLFNNFSKEEDLADISLPHYESVESLDITINDNFFRPSEKTDQKVHKSEFSTGALSMDQLNTSDVFGENAIAAPNIFRPKKSILFDFPSDENLENISEPTEMSSSSDSDSLSLIYSHEMFTDNIFNDSKQIDKGDIDKLQPTEKSNKNDEIDVIRQFNLNSSISAVQLAGEINDVIKEFCKIYNDTKQ